MASQSKGKGKRNKVENNQSQTEDSITDASSEGEKPLLKRDTLIASTGHNAHLHEDYEPNETLLVGRKVRRRKPKNSDKQSIESQSITSFPSDLTLSSHTSSSDHVQSPLVGVLKSGKQLQTVPEETEARTVSYAPSPVYSDDTIQTPISSTSSSRNVTPIQSRRKLGLLGRFWASESDRHSPELSSAYSHWSSPPTQLTQVEKELDFFDRAARTVGRNKSLDSYEPYTFVETPTMTPKLKKQSSVKSLQATRGRDGRLLMPRGSIVHPVGDFDDPLEEFDDRASYASVRDPSTGMQRLIRRDSVIHPQEMDERWSGERRRRNSIVRPLQMEQDSPSSINQKNYSSTTPRMYKRYSVTHGDGLSGKGFKKPSDVEMEKRREAYIHRHLQRSTPAQKSGASSPITPEHLPAPKYINGRFEVPWETQQKPSLFEAIKWKLTSTDSSRVPKDDELNRSLPLLKPNFKQGIPENGIRITWLGHSTVLVQMEKIVILTDPTFSDRASPMWMMGPRRYRRPPCTISSLPKVDVVLISHNHYDHLDLETVRALNARFGDHIHWFVPLGLLGWMNSAGCRNVYELSWWEEMTTPIATHVMIAFTPAQHWCKRAITDENKVLWGSWCIIGQRYRFFFAGDTGYCDVFKLIGDKYGPFDLAAIPIGAYEPRWFMKLQHVNPFEAVLIHEDVNAMQSIGIHWGTFALTPEHYLAPRKDLADAVNRRGLKPHSFCTLSHGESKLIAKGELEGN